jgi:hypothetical protein
MLLQSSFYEYTNWHRENIGDRMLGVPVNETRDGDLDADNLWKIIAPLHSKKGLKCD